MILDTTDATDCSLAAEWDAADDPSSLATGYNTGTKTSAGGGIAPATFHLEKSVSTVRSTVAVNPYTTKCH